jgi:hypothetical protein
LKICSTSFVVMNEMQIKTIRRHPWGGYNTNVDIMWTIRNLTLWVNVSLYCHFGNRLWLLKNIVWSRNSTHMYIVKGLNANTQQTLASQHCNIIHNRHKVERTQVSFNT